MNNSSNLTMNITRSCLPPETIPGVPPAVVITQGVIFAIINVLSFGLNGLIRPLCYHQIQSSAATNLYTRPADHNPPFHCFLHSSTNKCDSSIWRQIVLWLNWV